MQYRRMGQAGLKLSELSLGSWVTFGDQVADTVAKQCMVAAYDAGVNFFDNAEAYAEGKSEIVMGKLLKQIGWRRENLVISTKIFWGGPGPNDQGLSRKHVFEGVNNALKRLQLDYVDLVFCHRPDPNTPIEETVRAMDLVIKQGKALYWGTSEWSAGEIMRADGIARQYGLTPPSMEQPLYNMFSRQRFEKEYAPVFRDLGYGSTIFSPLASGLLSGKYNAGKILPGTRSEIAEKKKWAWLKIITPDGLAKVKALAPIADDLGCTMAQLALAWCLKNPNVSTVITGASKLAQVKENMKAVDVVPKLTSEVMDQIETVLANKPK